MCFSEETELFWPIKKQSADKKPHITLSQRIFHLFIYSLSYWLLFQRREAGVASVVHAGWALAPHAGSWCSVHTLPAHALHTEQSQLVPPRGDGLHMQHFVVLQIWLGHLGNLLVTFRRSISSGISIWRPWGVGCLGHVGWHQARTCKQINCTLD